LMAVYSLSLESGTWTTLNPTGGPPYGRDGHSAIYDPVRDQVVMFAGAGPNDRGYAGNELSDTWRLVWGGLASTPSLSVSNISLSSAYPNPASRRASFRLGLPASASVDMSVYDLAGRLVHRSSNGLMSAGQHVLAWDASGQRASAGMYFVRVTVGAQTFRRVVALTRWQWALVTLVVAIGGART
jgi:FlgD Ig-like domain